ncbi:uncharacterized protein [Pseudochaenichthys georgianus]|uniref:uncharacterized protein n=1 Tax=Pseudochaenichthys georgianus TaxID=52239 RepID=UPI0039C4A28A
MIIWTQVPQAVGTPDCCVMVENLQNDDQEWRVARTLSWVRSGRVPIRVCNPHPFSIEIPQRRALATVSQVDPQAVKTEEELVLTHTGPSAVEVEVRSISSTPVPNVTVPPDHPALALQGEDLNHNEQQRLSDLLQRWTKVFAANEDDFGHTSAVLHQIPTGDAPPIRQRHRPVPPALYAELRVTSPTGRYVGKWGCKGKFQPLGSTCSVESKSRSPTSRSQLGTPHWIWLAGTGRLRWTPETRRRPPSQHQWASFSLSGCRLVSAMLQPHSSGSCNAVWEGK